MRTENLSPSNDNSYIPPKTDGFGITPPLLTEMLEVTLGEAGLLNISFMTFAYLK